MILLLCMAVGVFGVSCNGDDGAQGPPGPPGPPGEQGPPAPAPMDGDGDGMDGDDMSNAECTHELGPRDRGFTGSSGNDVICGNDRNNTINGQNGDDIIRGEGGIDTLNGELGDDMLYGGAGNDKLNGGPDNDDLYGEAGNDTLDGGAGGDELYGGIGDDTLKDEDLEGIDTFEGGEGTDTLDYSTIIQDNPSLGADVYWHIDLAEGETGKGVIADIRNGTLLLLDYISGIENVKGAMGLNHLVGDDENNMLTGGAADDKIKGMGGNDTIDGGGVDGSTELLDGGAGNDTLIVGGNFNLSTEQTAGPKAETGIRGFENLAVRAGVTGSIELTGDPGANMLTGGGGVDTLDGGPGDDTLDGGLGDRDSLTGGLGADTFVIMKDQGADIIADYSGKGTNGQGDKIYLKGFSAEEKKAGFKVDDSGQTTTVKVGSDVVVTLSDVGGSKVLDDSVTVMFKD